jgi:hypothetical protein
MMELCNFMSPLSSNKVIVELLQLLELCRKAEIALPLIGGCSDAALSNQPRANDTK